MSSVGLELPVELAPGNIPELDEQTRRYLATLILDETIEIPPSDRGNQYMYGQLSDQAFIELYRPLVDVLELDPATDRPPLRAHIDRASKLGLTPSVSPIYDRMTLSRVHSGLGFRAKFRFTDWAQSDFIDAGQRLARMVGKRPTRDIVTAAGRGEYKRLGDFPTVDDIKSRFGRLAVFHELIGYPSSKGWEIDDHLDWSTAFYRQNPDTELTARTLDHFSRIGRGPSKNPVLKLFGSISKYKQQTIEEFNYAVHVEEQDKAQRLEQAQELAQYDETLLHILAAIPEEERSSARILQVSAQYRLAKHLAEGLEGWQLKKGALVQSADAFARWCLANGNRGLTVASIETHASALGVFDDLWPMYRFQNVDLRLKPTSGSI